MDAQLCRRTRLLALCGYLVQCGLMLAFMLAPISEFGFDLGQFEFFVGLVVWTAVPYLVLVIMVQAFQKSRLATVPLQLALWLIGWGGAYAGWGILRSPGDALIAIAFITIPGLQLVIVLVASLMGKLIHEWDVKHMERAAREERALHAARTTPPPPPPID